MVEWLERLGYGIEELGNLANRQQKKFNQPSNIQIFFELFEDTSIQNIEYPEEFLGKCTFEYPGNISGYYSGLPK